MSLKAIASALGLAEDADEAGVLAAIAPLKDKSEQFDACASAVGVDIVKEGAELASVATAITALKDAKPGNPDPAKFVSIDTVTELQSEMSSMKTRLDAADTKERQQLLDDAQADGRLTPATRKHYDTHFKDVAALASVLAELPKSSLGGRIVNPGDQQRDENGLTEDQLALCSSMGWDPKTYAETLKGDAS